MYNLKLGNGNVDPQIIAVQATVHDMVSNDGQLCLQIFCVHSEPNFSLPWQRKRQYSSTSSGFITAGKRILTNAHCVDHHTQVRCGVCMNMPLLHPARLLGLDER